MDIRSLFFLSSFIKYVRFAFSLFSLARSLSLSLSAAAAHKIRADVYSLNRSTTRGNHSICEYMWTHAHSPISLPLRTRSIRNSFRKWRHVQCFLCHNWKLSRWLASVRISLHLDEAGRERVRDWGRRKASVLSPINLPTTSDTHCVLFCNGKLWKSSLEDSTTLCSIRIAFYRKCFGQKKLFGERINWFSFWMPKLMMGLSLAYKIAAIALSHET